MGAAAHGEEEKTAAWTALCAASKPPMKFVPFVLESSGAMGTGVIAFLGKLASSKSALDNRCDKHTAYHGYVSRILEAFAAGAGGFIDSPLFSTSR